MDDMPAPRTSPAVTSNGRLLAVQRREVDQLDGGVGGGVRLVVEACSTEADEPGLSGVVTSGLGDEVADVLEAFDVSRTYHVVPLGFTDREQRGFGAVGDADDGYVDLVAGAPLGVVDDAVSDAGRQAAEQVGIGVVQRPVTTDLLEVWAEDVANEAPTTGLPYACGAAGALKLVPDGPHDGVIEADERLGDAVGGAILAEDVRVSVQQAGVFEDVDGMCDVCGLALQIAGHAATRDGYRTTYL